MIRDMIFGTIGGLGLFLFGMKIMSDGLKKVAGQKMRKFLAALTKHRMIAVLVGAFTTCLIQSSSATTVMAVGFVNASLLTLRQALCVVLGANIGTTFTAWLVSGLAVFKITTYALPAIGLGFLVQTLGNTQKRRNIGQVLLGFGILFVGIAFMKDGFGPLKDSEQAQQALIWLGGNPLLAVLAGALITMLLQSSSATIAMVQILAFNGAFGSSDWHTTLQVVIPFILGDNIGTTITAQIAAVGTSVAARRTALGHTMFNVIGVIYMLPLIWTGTFGKMVVWITPWQLSQTTIMVHIAVAHSVFNVFNTIVFLPIIGWLEAIVVKIIPAGEKDAIAKPVILEKHLLGTPVIAIDQAKREAVRMAKVAKEAVNYAIEGLEGNDRKKLKLAIETEDSVDNFQYEITLYLTELSRKELGDEVATRLPVLLHTVNDLERVGDHAVNIAEIAERKIEQKLVFSDSAEAEAARLKKEVNEMLDYISVALENDNIEAARAALENEENLNQMQIDFRRNHVRRMTEGGCSVEAGLIFVDLVDNVEKIGDHLKNIAQAVIGGLQWDGFEAKKQAVIKESIAKQATEE
ncbi:MAG: Na/Pi cotransporter family protein [Planctomycetes bacterium]|nr:Na/Pi cotransporter family protein [Planctomycetota bacterium]